MRFGQEHTTARVLHGVTAAVTWFAVVLQLILVLQGHRVLDEVDPSGLTTRLVRFASYLTIWSNVLVAVTATSLTSNPQRDGQIWRWLRLDAIVIVFGGGLVHFFFLRPLLDLHGADLLADRLLHIVVPLLATVGWMVAGPRDRIDRRDLLGFLILPVAWLVYTLIRGEIVDWYPYPFLDVQLHSYDQVIINCVLVATLMLGLAWGAFGLDRWLQSRQGSHFRRTQLRT